MRTSALSSYVVSGSRSPPFTGCIKRALGRESPAGDRRSITRSQMCADEVRAVEQDAKVLSRSYTSSSSDLTFTPV